MFFFGFLFKIAPTLGVSPWNSLQVHCVTVSFAQLDPIIDTRELYGSHFYSRCGVKWNFLLLYSQSYQKWEVPRARERSEKFIIESKSPNQNRDLIGKKSRISMENNDFNQLFFLSLVSILWHAGAFIYWSWFHLSTFYALTPQMKKGGKCQSILECHAHAMLQNCTQTPVCTRELSAKNYNIDCLDSTQRIFDANEDGELMNSCLMN